MTKPQSIRNGFLVLALAACCPGFIGAAAPLTYSKPPVRHPLAEVLEQDEIDGLKFEGLTTQALSKELLETMKEAKALKNAKPRSFARRARRTTKKQARKNSTLIKVASTDEEHQKNWSKLRLLSYAAARRALRPVRQWDTIQPLAESAVAENSCQRAGVALALATKSEEYLPDQAATRLTKQLYASSLKCEIGAAEDSTRFRLAMLEILNKNCNSALPHLEKLSDSGNRLFLSRALYWQHECLQEAGNDKKAAIVQMRLLSEQPFSFHTLLLAEKVGFDVDTIIKKDGPLVAFRSGDPEIDRDVRRVELLHRIDEHKAASRLLTSIAARTFKRREELVDFRLYLSVLKFREKDYQRTFALATDVLRVDQNRLSAPMLKLLFPQPYRKAVGKHAGTLEPLLVTALIRQESSFNPQARSHAGARGLMQLLPSTLRLYSVSAVRKIHNPDINIEYGSKYFAGLLSRFNNQVEFALAGYNAGPGRVDQWLKRYAAADPVLLLDLIPFTETREYVSIIMRNYYWYRWLEKTSIKHTAEVVTSAQAQNKRNMASVLKSLNAE